MGARAWYLPGALWAALIANYGHTNEVELGELYVVGPYEPPVPLFAERVADGLLLNGPFRQAE